MRDVPSAERLGVSRETYERLQLIVDEVTRWQKATNLIAPSTLPTIWSRHVEDSLQLLPLIGEEGSLLDIGSGGGFPGLIFAAAQPSRPILLVDSDARKCAFLRHVGALLGSACKVHRGRVEQVLPKLPEPPAIVTARGVAPLATLLAMTESLLRSGTVGIFPKGRSHAAELTEARKDWRFDVSILPSRTDPEARIFRVTNLARATDA